MIDIIILSHAKSEYHKIITQQCIDSLQNTGIEHKIYIHEQNKQVIYPNCNHFFLDEPFNYNKFMNIGASLGASDYITFCNNDLEFEKDWAVKIIEGMQKNNLDSASPFCRNVHGVQSRLTPTGVIRHGWTVRLEFAGWCFVMKRKSWEKIGGLDEDFSFWCADNAVVEQLKYNNMQHALVTNSIVNHIGGGENTLKYLSPEEKEQLTFVQIKKFNKKYNKNVWGMGQ